MFLRLISDLLKLRGKNGEGKFFNVVLGLGVPLRRTSGLAALFPFGDSWSIKPQPLQGWVFYYTALTKVNFGWD